MSLATDEGTLRRFCARILGWSTERAVAVEHALRSIEFAMAHRAAFVLLGDADLVPIAHALHRRMFGAEQPFIMCDLRREDRPAPVRSPAAYKAASRALEPPPAGPCACSAVDCHEISPRPTATQGCSIRRPSR
jgi:hypothetical protein